MPGAQSPLARPVRWPDRRHGDRVTAAADHPIDPGALIRSRGYVGVLILAAIVGIVVSIAGWAFLELTVRMQHWVYQDLPTAIGFSATPWWWPLPILGIAGIPIAYAI